jgi:hypothetical protein
MKESHVRHVESSMTIHMELEGFAVSIVDVHMEKLTVLHLN